MLSRSILLIEDDQRIRSLMSFYFRKEGYSVLEAEYGQKAIELFDLNRIALIVLDIMMPSLDGWQVCSSIRKISNVPIIIVTARDQEEDKIFGFELGADDYITKPFSPKVLVLKAKALLKRVEGAVIDESVIKSIGKLSVDNNSHVVTVNGNRIILSPLEYELLCFLMTNVGKVVSRQQILNSVWGLDYYGDLRTVDTHIWRLREKIQNSGVIICTVRGFGYRMEG